MNHGTFFGSAVFNSGVWIYSGFTCPEIHQSENLASTIPITKNSWTSGATAESCFYKRADHQNPKWTVRIKISTIKGFVVKSTKTTDDFEARRFAEHLYYQLEGKAVRGERVRGLDGLVIEWSFYHQFGPGLPALIEHGRPSETLKHKPACMFDVSPEAQFRRRPLISCCTRRTAVSIPRQALPG